MCARLPKLCSRIISELLPVEALEHALGFENFCQCVVGRPLLLEAHAMIPWMIIHPNAHGLVELFINAITQNTSQMTPPNVARLFGDSRSYSGTFADLFPRIQVILTTEETLKVGSSVISLPMSSNNKVAAARCVSDFLMHLDSVYVEPPPE
jgi:hypothetical protein